MVVDLFDVVVVYGLFFDFCCFGEVEVDEFGDFVGVGYVEVG